MVIKTFYGSNTNRIFSIFHDQHRPLIVSIINHHHQHLFWSLVLNIIIIIINLGLQANRSLRRNFGIP